MVFGLTIYKGLLKQHYQKERKSVKNTKRERYIKNKNINIHKYIYRVIFLLAKITFFSSTKSHNKHGINNS